VQSKLCFVAPGLAFAEPSSSWHLVLSWWAQSLLPLQLFLRKLNFDSGPCHQLMADATMCKMSHVSLHLVMWL